MTLNENRHSSLRSHCLHIYA